jgi:alpha-mannosidase
MAHFPAERDIIRKQITNRLERLSSKFYRLARPIVGWETVCTGGAKDIEPVPTSGWEAFNPPAEWGGPDLTNWFRTTVTIPEEMSGEQVYAILPVGGEALCRVNGRVHQGLDQNRWPMLLCEDAAAGETYELVLEVWSQQGVQKFEAPSLTVRDELAWDLYWDLRVPFEAAAEQPAESGPQVQLLDLVDRVSRRIDAAHSMDAESWHNLAAELRSEMAEGLKKFPASPGAGALTLASHSHIDVAWMWRLRETRRKVGRTWSTVLHLMDQYPEATYLQSQPHLYEYVKDHYPELWERVKERVKEGRWEANGAAWVEQDMNLPCGESHVRQYFYGNRFYRREFGIQARMVWLPDCFGFTFSLPQIMKKAQIDVFGTWKLHYNQYEQHPYCFFRWKGIDGTEVPAVSLPTLCGGDPSPHELKRHWDAYRQKDLSNTYLHVFGHGDGGGGPTAEMFEYVQRQESLVGCPSVQFGSFQKAFDDLCENVDWDRVPVFNDELYLELHRGCQTSQAKTKRNNRRSELAARNAEYFATRSWLGGTAYPHDDINAAWRLILLNQFHDILPGSSIAEVYEDAEEDYATVFATLAGVQSNAIGTANTVKPGESVTVHNTLGWQRECVVELELTGEDGISAQLSDGTKVASQSVIGADGNTRLLVETGTVDSYASATVEIVAGSEHAPESGNLNVTTDVLENDLLRVEIGADGTFSRIFDKEHKREVLAEGARGNMLALYDDQPSEYDAWEIDFNYAEISETIDTVDSVEVIENGPIRATVRITRSASKSTVIQDISLHRDSRRVDVKTVVDWHEKNRLLKALFPVNVHSRTATYEIQYGAIERATHYSTSRDRARYEVPAHRWIDLSETGYGVSLLNDCKYGFGVHENVMNISLLRSPTMPDPNTDQGRQEFTYSLYPHAGSWQDAHTVRSGYELNVEPVMSSDTREYGSMVSVDADNVVIDWVKKAEDSEDVIVRLYESHGARGPVTLSFGDAPKQVSECDLMEENDETVVAQGNTVSFDITPWEIRTFKVRM